MVVVVIPVTPVIEDVVVVVVVVVDGPVYGVVGGLVGIVPLNLIHCGVNVMSSIAMIASRSTPVLTPIMIYMKAKYQMMNGNEMNCFAYTSVALVKIELNATSIRCHEHLDEFVEHDE